MFINTIKYISCRILTLILFFKDAKIVPICFTILFLHISIQTKIENEIFSNFNFNYQLLSSKIPILLFIILIFFVSQKETSIVHNLATSALLGTAILFLALSSISLTYSQFLSKREKFQSFIDKNIILEGKILSTEDTDKYILGSRGDEVGKILLKFNQFTTLHPGVECKIHGKAVEPKSFEDFDYKKYLYRKGIYGILEVTKYECSENTFNLLILRSKLERIVFKNLSEPESSLLIGILVGSKQVFTKDFNLALQNSGLSHIISASGYNVALVASIVDRSFGKNGNKLVALVKIFLIWTFAIFAGLSSSLVRASTMATIHLFVQLLGRDISRGISILLCATVLVLLNPFILYDIGFLLSSSATVGLIFFPKCFNIKSVWIKDSFLPVITCTIFTLPVIIYFFSKISLVSILTNLIAIPIVQYTVGFGVVVIFLNSISNIFSFLFFIPYVQLNLFRYLVEISSLIPSVVIEFDPKTLCLIMFLSIFIFTLLKYPISNENYYLKKAKSLTS